MAGARLVADSALDYCVSPEVHDAQILENCARYPGRVFPGELKAEALSVVCFGPSLRETWQSIIPPIMTCSGAYKFLRSRGITPDYHMDVDPRPHKAELIGDPAPATTFLMASCCHPSVLALLPNVTLWNSFDAIGSGVGDGWHLYGGSTAGLRALTLARFIGFRSLDIFGMDGSFTEEEHAAPHPNEISTHVWAEFRGRKYLSTPSLVNEANDLFRILPQLVDVDFRFHGFGLIPDMATAKFPIPRKQTGVLAVFKEKQENVDTQAS